MLRSELPFEVYHFYTDDFDTTLISEIISTLTPEVWAELDTTAIERLKAGVVRTIKKMAAFYDSSQRVIQVSVHAQFGLDNRVLCKILKRKSESLLRAYEDVNYVNFVGDFNHFASEMATPCQDVGVTKIFTNLDEAPYSSSSNDPKITNDAGGNNLFNIDLLVRYTRATMERKVDWRSFLHAAPFSPAKPSIIGIPAEIKNLAM